MPVLPFIEDTRENILSIVRQAKGAGAAYILASFGMTLRDRQREYYYRKLDELFPGVTKKYERHFGGGYFAAAENAKMLEDYFFQVCNIHDIPTRISSYQPNESIQPSLF